MVKSVVPSLFRLSALPFAASLVLAGCFGGGGGDGATTTGGAAASGLSGTVAVGAPMSDAKVRIIDAAGNVVASDVSVDASGHFTGVTLTGTGPFRIEACGHAGENYKCVYSVAQGAGVANVTPLTTAAVLLAANESPEALMSGPHSGLGASAMNTAQGTLRTSLSSILSDAGVGGSFDFVSGDLSAGSRAGYDRVLDAVGVSTGEDAHPFVQITPRLGTGNIYVEAGSAPVGSIVAAAGSSGLNLAGLETLFQNMTRALVSSTTCSDGTIGMATLIDNSATMSMGGPSVSGSANVGAAFCSFIPSGQGPGWGVTVMSPTLGRCDFTDSSHPVCQVSFTIRQTNGVVKKVGDDMTVRLNNGGVWKFAGSAYPLELHANATAQRDLVLDGSGATLATNYARALAFNIEAYTGLLCAKVSQKDANGASVLVAYYKNQNPGVVPRLSVWRNTADESVATNPATGAGRHIRAADDTWLQLPQGAGGDAQVRNFFQGGRSVTIELFGDADCTSPLTVGSADHYEVDVHGLPPLWAKMDNLPWPTLTDATFTSLKNLTLATSASTTFTAAWTFARGYIGFDEASFCATRACGQSDPGRIGDDGTLLPTGKSLSLSLTNNSGSAVTANGFKMLAMYGKDGDGMMMQSNVIFCTTGVDGSGQCI